MKPSQSRFGKNGEEHYRSETRPNASYSVKISLKIATRLKPCHNSLSRQKPLPNLPDVVGAIMWVPE